VTTFLSITNLRVSYGNATVLRGVNLDVAAGDFTAIVGPSGCGKTTLLRTIAGLERATSGDMRLGANMLTTHGIHLAPHKRNIGWVPQDASLFPHLTVAENVAFGLATSIRGVKKAARGDRVHDLLELVSLSPLGRRMPHELSGGQAQRVALARALANTPQLVLLDEPFAGLDPTLRAELRIEIRDILALAGTASLLVTHDQTEALSLASRVSLMHDGIIEQTGSPLAVYFSPATLWCAGFLGEANVLKAELRSEPEHGAGRDFPVTSILGDSSLTWMETGNRPSQGAPISMMIRPESLRLTAGHGWRVLEAFFAGHDGLVTLASQHEGRHDRIKVLVPAREIPLIGAKYDVTITGAALGYGALS
jgi:iron(III) transport system ATP-binding protein